MKRILSTLSGMLFIGLLFGQQLPNFWKQTIDDKVFLPEKSQTILFPEEYTVYQLDLDEMVNYLRQAPMEGTAEAKAGTFEVLLPMPDGSFERFMAWESPILHPDLAARYPMIKSYAGKSVEHPSWTARFGYSPAGFYAMVPSANGGALLERYATFQNKYYVCYRHSGFLVENLNVPIVKYIRDKEEGDSEQAVNTSAAAVSKDGGSMRGGGGEGALAERRDYLFVLACTGEFGSAHGNDVPTVLGVLAEALATMNSLLERDIDVRFTMHPNNDQVVFLNPTTDPYQNANSGGALLGQNEDVLNDIIGQANFDVGHVYTGACNDVGGVVSGTVCATGKARGVTCNFSSNVMATTLSIAAHEIMHQFSGGHTFNHCPGNEGQFSSSSSWEPGSGSTILSYQGACGPSNIPGPATVQYHAGNVGEVWSYTHDQGGAICTNINPTSNHSPVVTLNYDDGFYIPISTPFELEAHATDADGDDLTYSWEQMNRSPSVPLGQPAGDAPSFRVYDHTLVPVRYFPRMATILNNTSEIVEVLPAYSKNLHFRCLVRDNNVLEGAAGITWADVSFKATESAGPFVVTSPNSAADVWTAGEQVEITWDVANTDNDEVNCKSVNIYLSTNGGNTFDYLLLAGTPNDGSEVVTVPELVSSAVRLKIKAADNIFFDVSNANFQIKPAAGPFYSLQLLPQYQRTCAPDINLVDVEVNAFAGFDQPVELQIVDGLPPGATVNFSQNPVMPGQTTTLTFDMTNVTDIGVYEVSLQAVSGGDTTYRQLYFNVVYNDFSDLVLEGPDNGGSGYGLQPVFEWTDLPQAEVYDFQLSTTPFFEPNDIVLEVSDIEVTELTPDFALDENTIYYWRIRPSNECGKGDFSLKSVFQTFNSDCTGKNSTDVPIPISPVGLPVIESQVTVLESGIISDVNIKNLKGTHDALADLRVSVISPAGTQVKLFENICGNVTTFDLNLNDESPFEIDCPPLGGFAYRPQEPLANFIGENTLGNWTLKVEVISTLGAGGTLQGWTIEFCASITPGHPFLLENDTLYVKPGESQIIHNYQLFAADPDDATADLHVNIIDETQSGFIAKNGQPLGVGDYFRFTDINDGIITYTNTDPDATYDFFTFTITDGRGGLLGTPKFNIVITEDAVTDVDELSTSTTTMMLYPNPANDAVYVRLVNPLTGPATLSVADVQGRLLGKQKVTQQANLLRFGLNGLPDGLYFLSLQTPEGITTQKLVVQH
ncbi:MAG TPA: T9SS type A sorting domain-containing protein [Bacteroidetes bacterium]|nr:T9SS type A sorting domain-containing protein [Bacteroidota bacterium]